jgi:hypothetical protein
MYHRVYHTRTIYGLATESGELFYIGKAGVPESRLIAHLRLAKRRKTLTDKKIHELNGNIKLVIIEKVKFKGYPHLPNRRELYWIGHYSEIYDLTNIQGNPKKYKNIIK